MDFAPLKGLKESCNSHSMRSVVALSILRKLSSSFLNWSLASLLFVPLGGSEDSELATGLESAFSSGGLGQNVLKTAFLKSQNAKQPIHHKVTMKSQRDSKILKVFAVSILTQTHEALGPLRLRTRR